MSPVCKAQKELPDSLMYIGFGICHVSTGSSDLTSGGRQQLKGRLSRRRSSASRASSLRILIISRGLPRQTVRKAYNRD
eukprot:scaffold112400_cov31-Prasinocladus_malaysianus.AAC.1